MSYFKEKLERIIKMKKNPDISAKKLGINVEKYIQLKAEYLKERAKNNAPINVKSNLSKISQSINLDAETGELSGIFDQEPKSADEIIKLLKIDTTIWKLSQYWNKQMGDHWRVSALITKLKINDHNYIDGLIENWVPKTYSIPQPNLSKLKNDKSEVCGILSLQDIHFGKEGNDTIDLDFETAVKDLIHRASSIHYISKLYFVLGGDILNMDTFGGTTTEGTLVDNSKKATQTYIEAFNAIHWAIWYIKQFCNKMVIVYIPGNHDRLSSFHLAHALSKTIQDVDIEWDIKYAERKVHVWNNNFNAFEHGDVYSKNSPLIYASEFPKEWGATKYRTLFTGHTHTEKKIEYTTSIETVGFIHKTLPSLSKTDYWHYHNKYVGNRRSGKIELQDPNFGNICELTCQIG